MRICVSCQDEKEENEIDSKYDMCGMCMGFKIAQDNMNKILPILNDLQISYKKESWGDATGIGLYFDKGIALHFANAGGVYFEYDKDDDVSQEKSE